MRGLEMKNCRGRVRANAEDLLERRIKRDGVFHAEKVRAPPAESLGIPRYQFPMMLFAAQAKNGHARGIPDQPAMCSVRWACCEAMISEKMVSRFLVTFQLG